MSMRVVLPISVKVMVTSYSPAWGTQPNSKVSVRTTRSGAAIPRNAPTIAIDRPSSCFHSQRNLPPTRWSSSQSVMAQPGGPNSHCLRSSGLRCVSQTGLFDHCLVDKPASNTNSNQTCHDNPWQDTACFGGSGRDSSLLHGSCFCSKLDGNNGRMSSRAG